MANSDVISVWSKPEAEALRRLVVSIFVLIKHFGLNLEDWDLLLGDLVSIDSYRDRGRLLFRCGFNSVPGHSNFPIAVFTMVDEDNFRGLRANVSAPGVTLPVDWVIRTEQGIEVYEADTRLPDSERMPLPIREDVEMRRVLTSSKSQLLDLIVALRSWGEEALMFGDSWWVVLLQLRTWCMLEPKLHELRFRKPGGPTYGVFVHHNNDGREVVKFEGRIKLLQGYSYSRMGGDFIRSETLTPSPRLLMAKA